MFDEQALIAPMDMPEDVVMNAETRRTIDEMVDKLPEKQKIVFRAYYFNELKTHEIAESTGMPEGTVKVYLKRARDFLQNEVTVYAKKHGSKLMAIAIAPLFGAIFSEEAHACAIKPEMSTIIYKNAVLNSRAKDMGASTVLRNNVSPYASNALASVPASTLAIKIVAGVVGAVVIVAGAVIFGMSQRPKESVPAGIFSSSEDLSSEERNLEREAELEAARKEDEEWRKHIFEVINQPETPSSTVVPQALQEEPNKKSSEESVTNPIEEPDEEPEEDLDEELEEPRNVPSQEKPAPQINNYLEEVTINGVTYFIDESGLKYELNKDYTHVTPSFTDGEENIMPGGDFIQLKNGALYSVDRFESGKTKWKKD